MSEPDWEDRYRRLLDRLEALVSKEVRIRLKGEDSVALDMREVNVIGLVALLAGYRQGAEETAAHYRPRQT